MTPPAIAPTFSALFNFSFKSFAVRVAFKLGGSEGLFSLTKTIISGKFVVVVVRRAESSVVDSSISVRRSPVSLLVTWSSNVGVVDMDSLENAVFSVIFVKGMPITEE